MAIRTQVLDSVRLHTLLRGGWACLQNDMQAIDALNVFPIPDGDTGKNMSKTMEGAVQAAQAVQTESVGVYLGAFARGALLGARGNSGVILSQFIRGLADGAAELSDMTPADFCKAFDAGREKSYRAVFQPVEGTMLTLLREGSEFLSDAGAFADFETLFAALLPVLRESLARTPEKLEVLRQAGVVDSGGAGVVRIFEGMQAALLGQEPRRSEPFTADGATVNLLLENDAQMQYGYCTECILQLMPRCVDLDAFSMEEAKKELSALGDSLVAVREGVLVKIHIHTFSPEKVLAWAHARGEFLSVKIENMTLQHSASHPRALAASAVTPAERERQRFAVVAAVQGDGMAELFLRMGAAALVRGGQTENPSTDEFLQAFALTDAEQLVVLPNDSNTILAAQQAAQLWQGAQVRVLPTRSMAQGFAALSLMDPSVTDSEQFYAEMEKGMLGVCSAAVAQAVRDARLDGVIIRKGAYMGLCEKKVLCAQDTPLETIQALVQALDPALPVDVITVFYGDDVSVQERKEAEQVLRTYFAEAEIGFLYGGQPVYRYLFAIE